MPSKNLGGKTSLCRSYLGGNGTQAFGRRHFPPLQAASPPVLLQIPGRGLCRMQEKASETFLSKIEQGLPFLSKLLPGRSRPLPAPLRPLALSTLTPTRRVQPGSSLGSVHAWGAAPTSPPAGFPHGPKKFKGAPGKGGNVLEFDDP